jgi:NADPH:quinone reductase-like Zn-dependent oxidoreductase
MRAVAINEFGGPERLQEMDVQAPKVGPDSVLIRIKAASCNPVDYKIREGYLAGAFPYVFPLVMGWDASGVVEAVGPAVTTVSVGDEVYAYCRKDFIGDGTYAEMVSVPETSVAPKPKNLSHAEAACVPLAALTAYQSLFDHLMLGAGETILIDAGAGGVGSFAVQLARHRNATVIATASAGNHHYLTQLGAAEVIDYSSADPIKEIVDSHPTGIDCVFDLVGGKTLTRSVETLRDGGRLVSINEPPLDAHFHQRGIKAQYVFVRPQRKQLAALAELLDTGNLGVTIHEQFQLKDAARAQSLLEEGHVRGKVAINVDA